MNSPRNNVNNLLFLPNQAEYGEEIYSALLQFTLNGKTVVVICQSAPKLLPLINKLEIDVYGNKEILQRLIVICCENVSAAIKKLLDLHDWLVKPDIIIIDFFSFACTEDQLESNALTNVTFLQQLTYCLAALFNLMNCLRIDTQSATQEPSQNEQLEAEIAHKKIFSIVVLKERGNVLPAVQVGIIKELYYEEGNAYNEFRSVVDLVK